MGSTILVAQPISIFKAKLWKAAVKCEIAIFFNFWVFLKMYIFEAATFYLALYLSNQLNFFSGSMYL